MMRRSVARFKTNWTRDRMHSRWSLALSSSRTTRPWPSTRRRRRVAKRGVRNPSQKAINSTIKRPTRSMGNINWQWRRAATRKVPIIATPSSALKNQRAPCKLVMLTPPSQASFRGSQSLSSKISQEVRMSQAWKRKRLQVFRWSRRNKGNQTKSLNRWHRARTATSSQPQILKSTLTPSAKNKTYSAASMKKNLDARTTMWWVSGMRNSGKSSRKTPPSSRSFNRINSTWCLSSPAAIRWARPAVSAGASGSQALRWSTLTTCRNISTFSLLSARTCGKSWRKCKLKAWI